jgi:cytochrome bd-type quinol oxidase subunit 2
MVGVALVFGYALLGACFLIMKTDGAVKIRAFSRHFGLL